MLSKGEIQALVGCGEIGWSGEMRGDSLLLRLGRPLQPLRTDPDTVIDLTDQDSIDRLYGPPLPRWETFDLAPGQLVLCQVGEPVALSSRLCGAVGTLSHLARVGLATHVTSPWVLPGWSGRLTLELHNLAPARLRLRYGMAVARLVLFRLATPSEVAAPHPFYGAGDHLGSRDADELAGPGSR
jgi:deoxycytidine triphosphate deaminase